MKANILNFGLNKMQSSCEQQYYSSIIFHVVKVIPTIKEDIIKNKKAKVKVLQAILDFLIKLQCYCLMQPESKNLANKLWTQLRTKLKEQKQQMLKKGTLTIKNHTMRFIFKKRGKKPYNGYPLIFGFHGGGGCPPQVNQSQYENHKKLYDKQLPSSCIWFVPRSCQDLPDMWHRHFLQDLLLQIIQAFTILGQINPNRVFLTGYSAGGDGIYHMAPRMADNIAGAAMMAGHPNKVDLLNIRNIAFSIQVGALDHAYKRNELGTSYIKKINELSQKYGGYEHHSEIHQGKGHWMNKEDAKIFPWLFSFYRNPYPDLILFKQHPKRKKNIFYYIRIQELQPSHEKEVTMVFKNGNSFQIFSNSIITVMVNSSMINMEQKVKIFHNGTLTIEELPKVNKEIIQKTINERIDPNYIFEDEFVSVPNQKLSQSLEDRKKNLIIIEKQKARTHLKKEDFKPKQEQQQKEKCHHY